MKFDWDDNKNLDNIKKHGVSFYVAQKAFLDPNRVIAYDENHSKDEERLFCFGKINEKILTVRYTIREANIRIIGAGYWRKGVKHYEETNK